MKNFKIYAFLVFLFLESTSVSAQCKLDLYFGSNKYCLTNEVSKLFHLPEPLFKLTDQEAEPDPTLNANIGFEKTKKSDNLIFTESDNIRIFAYMFAKHPDNIIICIHGEVSNDDAFYAEVLQKAVLKNSSEKLHIIDKTTHFGF